MVPAVAAASAANIVSPLIGAWGAKESINSGMKQYRNYANKGIDTFNAGKDASTSAFSPFTTAGGTAASDQLSAVQNRQQAAGPELSNTNPGDVNKFLDHSMDYSIDQANKAGTAAGIASGGVGGGMLKALSNNANKMAMTNWNNAYDKMLSTNNQNFGQQQQQYTNNNDFQQSQINNLGGIAGMGLSATGQNQGIQQGYNNNINQNLLGIGQSQAAGNVAKGNLFNSTISGLGQNLAGGITSVWGAK